uniref:Glycosyl transferase n=1 Tax=Eubacterium cellulosolvens (strain ATCC 43171 / JCM 9499 / 6) TaxID=633697 RepID=I5AW56_EUBC6
MLSVIVPVYQAEKYIEKCVNSILNQSVDDIEIVLVDDGSSDLSGQKCDSFASKDKRIVTIHSENKGPFFSRRLGVQHSSGDIITFVDADDWVDDDSYIELLKIWNEHQPDILMWNYRYNKDGDVVNHRHESGVYSQDEIIARIIPNMMWDIRTGERAIDPSLCCKFFKRELYLEITKDIDVRITLGEDAIVTYPALCLAKKLVITNKAYYHYRIHEDSCVRDYSEKKISELLNFKKNILMLFSRVYNKKDFSYQVDCYLRTFLQPMIKNWFGCDMVAQKYGLPYKTIKGIDCIKLYGAGEVGRSYRRSLEMTGYADVLGWYDKSIETSVMLDGYIVEPASAIVENPSIPILVAVKKEKTALEIKTELIEFGIAENMIVWGDPISIV